MVGARVRCACGDNQREDPTLGHWSIHVQFLFFADLNPGPEINIHVDPPQGDQDISPMEKTVQYGMFTRQETTRTQLPRAKVRVLGGWNARMGVPGRG